MANHGTSFVAIRRLIRLVYSPRLTHSTPFYPGHR
jgi:hypothetical protein